MDNEKHTPGPWYSKKTSVYTTDRDGTFNKRVAECHTYEDAELIARVPELLQQVEALKSNVGAQVDIEIQLREENERLTKILSECQWYQTDHAQQAKRIEKFETLLKDIDDFFGGEQLYKEHSKTYNLILRIKAALNLL